MPNKNLFASEDSYKSYKQREYDRYYGTTQLWAPRQWTDEELATLVRNYNLTARELSSILRRSVKSIEHKKKFVRDNELLPVEN